MRKQNTRTQNEINNNDAALAANMQDGREVEVLYQKMGNRWYAFSMIDEEVFFGSISDEEIHDLERKNARRGKSQKIAGNS